MVSSRWLLVPITVAAAACGSQTLPSPHIESVDAPAPLGYLGEDTTLSLTGENLAASVTPDAGNAEDSKTKAPSIWISGGGLAAPVEVTGEFLDPEHFEGEIPATLPAGRYDVQLMSGGDVVDTLAQSLWMGHRAVTLVIGSSAEPAPHDSNEASVALNLVALDGTTPGVLKQDLALTDFTLTSAATMGSTAVLAMGESDTVVTVLDTKGELVTLNVTLPGGVAQSPAGGRTILFRPGPVVRVLMLTLPEVNSTDTFIDTFIQVEDAWQNPSDAHLAITVDVNFSGECPAATAVPNPVSVAANAGTGPVRVNCNLNAEPTINLSESGTATGYDVSTTTILDFN